jgi:death-on-curing protein
VSATREPFLVRDYGLLVSACARPAHLWAYGANDLTTIAAALLFGIARNHPFQQGNKRTGYIAFVDFLEANGFAFVAPDTVRLANSIIAVVEGRHAESDWIEIARQVVVPL